MSKKQKFMRNKLAASVSLALMASSGFSVADDSVAKLEEVIVTGTPGGKEVEQLNAPFSITSLDSEGIARFAPKSTADLLKTVPSVWSESSGGVAGANIFIRGLPSNADADHLTISLQGAPTFGASTISFMEQTTIFRVDETIKRVEGLRGGANTILSNGQPGLTTNFILKEGSEDPEGLVKLTVGDYGLARVDAVHSGPLGGGWNYMVGGYTSESDSTRDTGFTSEEGQQLTVNLTKELDDGKISVYNRYTDDHGQWFVGTPIALPGDVINDVNAFTQLTDQNRFQELNFHPTFAPGTVIDLADGRGFDGNIFGVNFEKEFGNITLRNRFNRTTGDVDVAGLVPGAPPNRADTFDALVDGSSIVGRGVDDGSVVGAGTFVAGYSVFYVEKDIEAMSNDFTLTTQVGSHELTGGIYYADYSSDDVWALENNNYYAIGGGRLNVDCVEVGNCGSFSIVQNGDAQRTAFYIHDSWQVTDELAVDFGFRRDDHEAEIDFAQAVPNTTRPFGVTVPALTRFAVDESETSFTAGANYRFNDTNSVFLRVNEGADFSQFDDVRNNQGDLDSLVPSSLSQYEIGYKWQSDASHVYLTLFSSELDGAPIILQTSTGPRNEGKAVSEAQGLEIDVNYAIGNFAVNVIGTVQSTEQVNASPASNIGNAVQRIPDELLRIAPSYTFNWGSNTLAVYGSASYTGSRFSDSANLQPVASYTKLDIGALFTRGDSWVYRVSVDNLNDEVGLTEGNPRIVGPNVGISATGRSIQPRSIKASVQYNF